jgi:23S rRNA pseudouridine2457 synthase
MPNRAKSRPGSTPADPAARVVLLNKPYGVLCQFRSPDGRPTLADFCDVPDVYPAGRLDADSEGLVVLTASGALQAAIADPRHKLPKTYWVQVEGVPTEAAVDDLRRGVGLADGPTRPARVRRIDEPPGLWPRRPPIRVRRAIATAWLEITIAEGRNRQVRRMTAAVGFPTLRLVRCRVGPWSIDSLAPGAWRDEVADPRVLSSGALSPRSSAPRSYAPRSSARLTPGAVAPLRRPRRPR